MADHSKHVRVRGVYGKPWTKMARKKIEITPAVMTMLGNAVLEGVRHEIRRAVALSTGVRGRGKPIPIPRSSEFVESFQFRVRGASTVEITSDWPFAKAWEDGKDPYEMKWLNRKDTPVVPIVTASGATILRVAPLQTEKAWIHPGFARYSFLAKGIKRGREAAAKILYDEVVYEQLTSGDVL